MHRGGKLRCICFSKIRIMNFDQKAVVTTAKITFWVVFGIMLLLLLSLFLSGISDRAVIQILSVVLTIIFCAAIAAMLFHRRVLLPLRRVRDFTSAAAKGEKPPRIDGELGNNSEIRAIALNLNMIRDRMQNLETKLSRNLASDLKSQHQREHFNQLKNDFFTDLLPQIRRSAGVIKGQLLIVGKQLEQNLTPDEALLKKALRRIDIVSRDLEKLADVDRINWERWNSPRNDKFDTSELIHELLENDRLNSRTRNIKVVSKVSGELPGRLCIDRELLFQLLSLLTRSVCRLAEPNSEVIFNCGRDHRGEAVFELIFPCRIAEDIASREFRRIKPGEGIISGLEIVKSCAGLIGCMLEIYSKEKDKAVFKLSLPQGSSTYSAGSFSALPNHHFFPTTRPADDREVEILLFEDDADHAEVVKSLLDNHKIATTIASDLEHCRKALETKHFDSVLICASSGTAAPRKTIRQLREFAQQKKLPAVIVSPEFSEVTRRQIENYDNCYLMPVPLNYRLLAEVLHRIRS